jgi:diketogulonate reductase-like aldo/keto reductase
MSKDFYLLNNGISIPAIGFGVFKMKDPAVAEKSLITAFESGYRLIDTAAIYGNEEVVGKAIKASGLKREEIFVTTKVWATDVAARKVAEAYEESLRRLQLDYVDLYLIHWPVHGYVDAWKEMEKLYAAKRMRAIGVSNFTKSHLEHLMHNSELVPALNQIETHPYLQQEEFHQYMKNLNILHQAWGPLGQGKNDLLVNSVLAAIGDKYNKTTAQVMLRWHFQRGISMIPKSQTPTRIVENINIFDFSLTYDDMEQIRMMDRNQHFSTDPNDREAVEAFAKP